MRRPSTGSTSRPGPGCTSPAPAMFSSATAPGAGRPCWASTSARTWWSTNCLGSYYDGPYYNQAFTGDWTQGEVAGTVTLRVHQAYGTHVRYRFTTTLIGAPGADPA